MPIDGIKSHRRDMRRLELKISQSHGKGRYELKGLLRGYGFWKNDYHGMKLFSILRREYFETTG